METGAVIGLISAAVGLVATVLIAVFGMCLILIRRMDAGFDSLRNEITSSANSLRNEITSSANSLRNESTSSINSLREETTSSINSLRDEMNSGFERVHARISEVERRQAILQGFLMRSLAEDEMEEHAGVDSDAA